MNRIRLGRRIMMGTFRCHFDGNGIHEKRTAEKSIQIGEREKKQRQ